MNIHVYKYIHAYIYLHITTSLFYFLRKSVSSLTIKNVKMAMTTGEIVVLVFLIIIVAIIIWYFAIAYMFGQTLNNFSYTRGANLDTKDKNKGAVKMTCEQGNEICTWKATAICSGAISGASNSEGGPEPISNGDADNSAYGQFDVYNTIDLTKDMSSKANGKQNYTYNFDVTNRTFGKSPNAKTCPMNYDTKTGAGQRPQLIATYTCIPKGTKCVSSNPIPPPIPVPPKSFSRIGTVTGMTTISINNKNQICSTNNKGEILCSANYKSPSVQWSTLPGLASQVSLSDSGSMSAVTSSGTCFYLNNFADPNSKWVGIPGTISSPNNKVQSSWTTNRLFNSGQQKVIGNIMNNGLTNQLWTSSTTDKEVNKLNIYNLGNFDSNTNGDICGVGAAGFGDLGCYSVNGSVIGASRASFNPVSISVNSKGVVCTTSSSGDILCTDANTLNNPTWETVSKGQKFSMLSIANDNTICAIKNTDGSVWCNI